MPNPGFLADSLFDVATNQTFAIASASFCMRRFRRYINIPIFFVREYFCDKFLVFQLSGGGGGNKTSPRPCNTLILSDTDLNRSIEIFFPRPSRGNSVGRASFKGPTLVQLY